MDKINLLQYSKKIYSQFGEEGVLEFLLKKLKIDYVQCCEFGMSGYTFSNTLYFIENFKSYGVFIDKSSDNLKNLDYTNTFTIAKKIEYTGKNTLDNLLKSSSLNTDFDILSIDVDNEDYHIWKSLNNYKPKIVVIEFNPFLPPTMEYVHNGSKFSSSFLSTVKLGESKGYKLVCMTGNLIFVLKNLLQTSSLSYLLHIDEQELFLSDAMISPENKKCITFKRYYKLERHRYII